MMIAIGINFYDLKFQTDRDVGFIVSSVFTIIICAALLVSIALMIRIIFIFVKNRVHRCEINAKFQALVDSLNNSTKIGSCWNLLVIFRWIVTITILIVLRDHHEL